MMESAIACDMSAIEPAQRTRHVATAKEVFSAVAEIRELPDGYAFQLSDEPDILVKTAEFVSLEKLCCPFLRFVVEIEAEGGAIRLRLTGREGVKEFIREEVGGLLGAAIDWAL